MAKHRSIKDKLREDEFKKKIFESLRAAEQRGLLIGTRTMLRVIGDKIKEDNGKTAEEKLADIMNYINTSLEMTDKTTKEADERVANANKPIEALGQDSAEEPQEEDK